MRAEADPPRPILDTSIVPMRRKHVRDVLSIERRVYPRPWSAALFFSEISQRKTRHYVVAMVQKEVAGYGGLMVHEDEGHITTIAVEPDLSLALQAAARDAPDGATLYALPTYTAMLSLRELLVARGEVDSAWG